jgi:hypothetical protein
MSTDDVRAACLLSLFFLWHSPRLTFLFILTYFPSPLLPFWELFLLSMLQHARVNGKTLPNFVGKNVFLVGVKKSENVITTADGIDVTCNLPPGETMESEFVHLVCSVTGNTEVSVTSVINMDADFDMQGYNDCVELMSAATHQGVFAQ